MVNPALCATTAMIARLFYPYFELSFGAIYPAYASWKSMKNRDRHQYQRWMMYWVTYGSFQLVQIFTDMFIGIWFPFYYELKIIFLIWLVSLNGHGARLLFTYVINHELTKHEKTIDVYFDRTSGLGNEIVWKLWTECSNLAPKVISVFLRLMIATSEGLPYFDMASKQSTVDSSNRTLSLTDSDSNNKNYNNPPMVDDINMMVMDSAVESDAISTLSDELIKSVRVSRAKSTGRRQIRTPSIDSLDSLLPMDCDTERTLVESNEDEEWTPSSASKRKPRKKSKPRVSKEKKAKLVEVDEQNSEQNEEIHKEEPISEAAPSDVSNPSSPSKSRSKTRILRKPRVIKRPVYYA